MEDSFEGEFRRFDSTKVESKVVDEVVDPKLAEAKAAEIEKDRNR